MHQASLVSIIVPVYNAEKFVSNTISSITAQTYENIEIIIINDGSTDNSKSICDELACGDTRIRVIHQENQDVSSARNAGIKESKGLYISFVDADDFIDENMIERMVEVMAKENVDMVIAQHIEQFKTSNVVVKCDTLLSGFYNAENFRDIVIKDYFKRSTKKYIFPYHNTGSPFLLSCYAKLFKSELIKGNEILFDPSLKIGEDVLFVYQCISNANRFYVISDYYPYTYVRHEEATTAKYEPNSYQRRKRLFNKFREMFDNNFPANFDQVYFYFALDMFYSLPMLPFRKKYDLIKSELEIFLNDPDLARSFQHVELKTLKKRDQLLFYLFSKKYLQLLLLILWIREKVRTL